MARCSLCSIAMLVLVAGAILADEPQKTLSGPFFAFDNGTGRGVISPEQQAKMLKELGYDGIGYTGTQNVRAMLDALDEQGLKMFSTYVGATVSPEGPSYDPGMQEAIKQFNGRETILWLFIRGRVEDDDEQAVAVVREIADMAAKANLRVCLYPHYGFYVATVEDAIRVARKVDRQNVGMALNLCHWLREGEIDKMEERIRQAMPHLLLVSINGADKEGGWDRLIQTLDRGEFDVYRFLTTLHQAGYRGPVGLQCYGVKGDRRENLQRSIAAWRKMNRRFAGSEE